MLGSHIDDDAFLTGAAERIGDIVPILARDRHHRLIGFRARRGRGRPGSGVVVARAAGNTGPGIDFTHQL